MVSAQLRIGGVRFTKRLFLAGLCYRTRAHAAIDGFCFSRRWTTWLSFQGTWRRPLLARTLAPAGRYTNTREIPRSARSWRCVARHPVLHEGTRADRRRRGCASLYVRGLSLPFARWLQTGRS